MMQYLCDKHQWDQWWPQGSDAASIQKRAKLSEYLSYHHHGTRMISHKIAFKLFLKQFFDKDYTESKEELKELSLKIIANFEKKGLCAGPFVGGSQAPTIADLFAYAEIYQLVYMHVISHSDLSPAMQSWAEALQALPAHDDVHVSLKKLAAAMQEKEKEQEQKEETIKEK
jgi:glutathione S-transferase